MIPFHQSLFKRELMGYFRTPVAYIFLSVFLLTSSGCSFFLAQFFESNQADLRSFFSFHPWIYLIFIPGIGMRLWSEEIRTGSIELLLTLPISTAQAVVSKFIAAWVFVGIALLLSVPMWLTVNYLGEPDNGVIVAGYLGSFLMAGAFLAISSMTSAMSKNQVVSFIMSVIICFALVLVGWGVFGDALSRIFPVWLVDAISYTGFVPHFHNISKGLIDSRDLVYFLSIIGFALTVNGLAVNSRKGN